MRWPSQLRRRLCIVMVNSSVLVHSSMLVIFLGHCTPRIFLRCLAWNVLTAFSSFFCESPQFSVVEEYTCYICIEGSDFDCVADFSAVKHFIQRFEKIYCKNLYAVYVLFRI